MTDLKIEVKQEEKKEVKPYGKRTPLHEQKRVGIKERAGFTRRLVNETPGRVESFLEAGWVPVEDVNQDTSDQRIQQGKNLGSTYRPVVNKQSTAPCQTAIWMEIPTKLYNEDQAAKAQKNNEIEESYDPRLLKQRNPDLYYAAQYDKT